MPTLPSLACIITLFFAPYLQAQQALLVNSYHIGHSGSDLRVRGFKERFPVQHTLHEIYMDTKRRPAKDFKGIANQVWSTFQSLKPKVVVLNDDNALRLLGARISEAGTPAVFMGINNNPRLYFEGSIPQNVIGILERHLIIPLVRHFSDFVPLKHNRVLVLFDESKTSDAVINVSLYGKTTFKVSGITIDVQKHLRADQYISAALNASKNYDFIVLDTFYTLQDANGKTMKGAKVLAAINHSSKIPMFGVTN